MSKFVADETIEFVSNEDTEVENNLELDVLEPFEVLHVTDARLVFNMGGAGSGKSKAVAQKIIFDMLTKRNCFYYVLRKHHTEVKKSIFDQLINEIYFLGLNEYFTINKTDRTIINTNINSKIICSGLYFAAKIKSLAECTNAFMEEADEFSREDFDYVNSRVRSKLSFPNQIILNFNPPNKSNWIATDFFDNGNVLPPLNQPYEFRTPYGIRCLALRTDYSINHHLPDDVVTTYNELKESNQKLYETLCLGVWASNQQGMYFVRDYYNEADCPLGYNFIYCDSAYSLEPGKGDYNCIIKATYSNSNNKIYINDVFLQKNVPPFKLLEKIDMMWDKNTQYIGIDANYAQKYYWRNIKAQTSYTYNLIEEVESADKLLPEALAVWSRNGILFPMGFEKTQTGAEALNQLFSFEGKKVKSKTHDDFPDAMICLIHIINKLTRKNNFLKGWI